MKQIWTIRIHRFMFRIGKYTWRIRSCNRRKHEICSMIVSWIDIIWFQWRLRLVWSTILFDYSSWYCHDDNDKYPLRFELFLDFKFWSQCNKIGLKKQKDHIQWRIISNVIKICVCISARNHNLSLVLMMTKYDNDMIPISS